MMNNRMTSTSTCEKVGAATATATAPPIQWLVFYSKAAGREYYYEPNSKIVTWILPDDAHPNGMPTNATTATKQQSSARMERRSVSFHESVNESLTTRDDGIVKKEQRNQNQQQISSSSPSPSVTRRKDWNMFVMILSFSAVVGIYFLWSVVGTSFQSVMPLAISETGAKTFVDTTSHKEEQEKSDISVIIKEKEIETVSEEQEEVENDGLINGTKDDSIEDESFGTETVNSPFSFVTSTIHDDQIRVDTRPSSPEVITHHRDDLEMQAILIFEKKLQESMARYLEEPKNEPSTFEQRVPPLSSIMIVKEDSFETVPLEDETTASNIMIVKEDPFETALLEDETITKYILEDHKQNIVKSNKECLIPFSHVFSKKCRDLARQGPLLDIATFLDNMMQ